MSNSFITHQRDQIQELLGSTSDIGIVIGENHNLDMVASGLALYLLLTSSGKNVQIVSKKEPIVEFSNLFGIDRITKSFEGNTKTLTISVPYKEGEIEKVSYNIDQDRLNVNLFAEEGGISFSEHDVEYIRKGSSPSLIITIGVSSEDELSGIVDLKAVKTILLDKNPMNTLVGDVSVIDPTFSSFAEIVTNIAIEADLGTDIDAFQNLMDGVTYATRNFTAQNTSAYAFESAGYLLQNGARRKDKSERQNVKRDTFPKEEHFLDQKPQQNNRPKQAENANNEINRQGNNEVIFQEESIQEDSQFNNEPVEISSQEPATEDMELGQNDPKKEASMQEQIPDDWFLPKVFKGSKKGN